MSASPALKDEIKLPGMDLKKIGKDLYEVFIGPQHPGSGHMRIIIRVDGDVIVEADPDLGYVHRTMEKLAEGREFIKVIPLMERMAILDACNITLPYVEAVEKLMDIEPPPRAKYLRVLLCEINRIASHLYGMGIFGVFLGHSTMYMWPFGDREVFVELAEKLTGARLTHTYAVPGGVRRDIPQGFREMAEKAARYMEKKLEDYKRIFLDNPAIQKRLVDVGVISKNLAAKLGIVGPNLRASGIRYDVRIIEPYEAYDEIDFEVPIYEEGDAYARAWIRVMEIKQSLNIIRQVLEKMPQGDPLHEKFWAKAPKLYKTVYETTGRAKLIPLYANLKVPAGRAIARAEAGRGEVIYVVESENKTKPYRVRVVSPSFRNAIVFKYIVPGHRIADLPAIYGSIDYFPPEADR
ncbi:MAG: NADH-quinone oxidoreductase subunit D [Desulfurococcales archaeon]|nr:NADH-quinone oxidoreductase subunit D [Desulfurococcales archaeon]